MDTVGNCVHIDVSQISRYQREVLAAATMDFINRILAQPGGRELLEKKKAELRWRKETGEDV